MTKRTITVQKALNELTLYDAKIDREIYALDAYFGVSEGNEKQKKEAMEKREKAKAIYQSIKDLLRNKAKLKGAIASSNANTLVKIGGIDYTVYEALEHKRTLEKKQELYQRLKSKFSEVSRQVESHNNKKDSAFESSINALLSNVQDEKAKEATIEQLKLMTENDKMKVYEFIIDENKKINNVDLIDVIQDEIDSYLEEVDSALTHSNVMTLIELDF